MSSQKLGSISMNSRMFKSTSGYNCGTGVKTVIDIATANTSWVNMNGSSIPSGANLNQIISKLQQECDSYYYTSGEGKYQISQQFGNIALNKANTLKYSNNDPQYINNLFKTT